MPNVNNLPAERILSANLDIKVLFNNGKGLSTEDFTPELKQKLESLTPGGGSSFSGSYNDLTDKPVFATVGGQRIDQGGNIPIEGGGSSPSVPTLQEHGGTSVTIAKLDGNTLHRCTDPLASLTVSALGQDTALEAVVLFETGQDWTGLTMPQGTAWAPMRPMPEAGRRYVMAVQNGIATLCPVVS